MQISRRDENLTDLVTIVVLCYSKFDDIYRTLDSIFQQTYSNIELVVSDDGSLNWHQYEADISAYVKGKKGDNITNVVIKHFEKNVGTSRHINAATMLANGTYIKYLPPGDEFFDAMVVEMSIKEMKNKGARILIGQTYYKRKNESDIYDEVKDSVGYRWKARSGRRCILVPSNRDINYLMSVTEERKKEIIASRCIISTISVFYRKDLLLETGGFPTEYRLVEDMPYWPQLALKGEHFYFCKIRMVRYSLDGISNNVNPDSEFNRSLHAIVRKYYIPNEQGGGIFNKLLIIIRNREIDYDEGRSAKSIKYIDVILYKLWRNFKYLLMGTRI